MAKEINYLNPSMQGWKDMVRAVEANGIENSVIYCVRFPEVRDDTVTVTFHVGSGVSWMESIGALEYIKLENLRPCGSLEAHDPEMPPEGEGGRE